MYGYLHTGYNAYLGASASGHVSQSVQDTSHLPNEHLQQPTNGHATDDIM